MTEISILAASLVAAGGTGELQPLPDLAPIDRPLAWSLGTTGAATDVRSYRVTYATDFRSGSQVLPNRPLKSAPSNPVFRLKYRA